MADHFFLQQLRDAQHSQWFRQKNPAFAHWAAGYGAIHHTERTQTRLYQKISLLHAQGLLQSTEQAYALLAAADRLTCASMWLVVHATYAKHVYLDGRDLKAKDFKPMPEGHTGGSLNMVPAYVGYLLANALSGFTRSWLMGQGHCVAAIDATNVLFDNMTQAHAARYNVSDAGLTQFVQDFYSYDLQADGTRVSPLGSHVNSFTAGGMMEGGFLGFAELQYVHVPLPHERLVAFLSDGAFEEQRGSDWAPQFWRAEDMGLVSPILIANGRRIEQRSLLSQEGNPHDFCNFLRQHHFDPIEIDGRDPADIAWAILEMEERLERAGQAAKSGTIKYPVPLPYGIAETIKGYGFPGAGTNAAHNLPLLKNPYQDEEARQHFNQGARALWVPIAEMKQSLSLLNNHSKTKRPKERDHSCSKRNVTLSNLSKPPWHFQPGEPTSPMAGLDAYFSQIITDHPHLRVRVGNPDELRSNGMNTTLDLLKHRVTHPEPNVAEAVNGRVITALNEEAVVCAALGNKAGLNLVVTYEAFATKMLGALRQEIIFTRNQKQSGQRPGWLAVPLVLTSHTFENGKNEQSHQDPTLCEALLGEMNDVSRVLFPADWNSAIASLEAAYKRQGEIWTLVVPKRSVASQFSPDQARQLVAEGATLIRGERASTAQILLIAVGAYQLQEILKASDRLLAKDIAHRVIYMIEPGKFREARDSTESKTLASSDQLQNLFPSDVPLRVILTHTRPHVMLGLLRPLDTGPGRTSVLGYCNHGGTLNTAGMLFVNRSTWAHVLQSVASSLHIPLHHFLTSTEHEALMGTGLPEYLFRSTQ